MLNPLARLQRIGVAVLGILVYGTVGFHSLLRLNWLDAFYFTVITMSTVGYREMGHLTDTGKLFTISLIFLGVGLLLYAFTMGAEILLDEQTRFYVEGFFNARRLKQVQNHFIVCGLGRVGRAVCEELSATDIPFLIVDSDPRRAQFASSRGWLSVLGDATEDRILEQASIYRARGLITCVETDATNLFIVVSAKSLNPNLMVSARVSDENNLSKFKRAGAGHVYSPFSLLGRRIARAATRPHIQELLDLALEGTNYDLTLEECPLSPESPLNGISLKDSAIRQRFGGVVLSIIRENRQIVHNPDPETVFSRGDILIVLGTPDQLRKLREIA